MDVQSKRFLLLTTFVFHFLQNSYSLLAEGFPVWKTGRFAMAFFTALTTTATAGIGWHFKYANEMVFVESPTTADLASPTCLTFSRL